MGFADVSLKIVRAIAFGGVVAPFVWAGEGKLQVHRANMAFHFAWGWPHRLTSLHGAGHSLYTTA